MRRSLTHAILCGALLVASRDAAFSADAQPATANAPLARETAVLVTVTASIEVINHTTH